MVPGGYCSLPLPRQFNRKQLKSRGSMASRMKCTMCRSGTQSLKSGGRSSGVNLSTFTRHVLTPEA